MMSGRWWFTIFTVLTATHRFRMGPPPEAW